MSINDNAGLDTSQVEDMRGSGGGGLIPGGGRTIGGGIVGLLIALVLGGLGVTGNLGLGGGQADNSTLSKECAADNPDRFDRTDCRNVLYVNSVQAYWGGALQQTFGQQYRKATTRFFSQVANTGCGQADSGVGPFYCPADAHVYIDLTFYDELANRFGAPGQFAQAYVLAHEYGHHVQSLLGTEQDMRRAQERDPGNANAYSIALELQADCYAGVWANHADETTDLSGNRLFTEVSEQQLNEALQAAAAVGDDAIQRKSGGGINQDTWTHGSSEQRQRWFSQGYRTGDPKQCDTFNQ